MNQQPARTGRSPRAEYQDRLTARRETLGRWMRLDEQLSYARIVAAGIGAAAAWLALWAHALSAWWLPLPALLFVSLAVRHDRVIRARDGAATSVAFYERGLARIEDRWMGTGDPGLTFLDNPDHPYAQDLDLFGRGSLFELLWTARTHAGEATLVAWLTRAADVSDIRGRQEAVAELRDRLDVREALALAGTAVRAQVDTSALVTWATATPTFAAVAPRVVAVLLSFGAVVAAIWWAMGGPAEPLVIAVASELLFARFVHRRIHQVLAGADVPGLEALAHLLARIEQEPMTSAPLSVLHGRLKIGRAPASAAIHRLRNLLVVYDWRHNLLFMPIGGLLLWSVQFAGALESWRGRFGRQVPVWLAAVGEFEALNCLGAYAYEHPADPFPELLDGPARFDGVGLGHPLLAASVVVRNDVRLAGDTRLLVVSGSNMSGKSTLLRTVGINAVLAMAGAPVRAERLALTPLAVGATLRIQDSLHAGRSRFFAEVTRVRELLSLSDGAVPLLFLFDELFQGTNSHDRLVGAIGVLRSLADRGAIGLVTTHDLALTDLTSALDGRAVNVHFEDRVEGDTLAFDYQMRPGPITRGNGLALMRAVGLDVQG